MTQPSIPKDWLEADQLDGYDFVNKGELLGAPFRILAVEFYLNAGGVRFARVEAEDIRRKPFAFNDSSTGVAAQLWEYFTSGVDGEPVMGTVYEVSLVAPRGLRESAYGIDKNNEPVPADSPTAVRKARTYYLTTSGKSKRPVELTEPVKPPAKGKTTAKRVPARQKPSRGASAASASSDLSSETHVDK